MNHSACLMFIAFQLANMFRATKLLYSNQIDIEIDTDRQNRIYGLTNVSQRDAFVSRAGDKLLKFEHTHVRRRTHLSRIK